MVCLVYKHLQDIITCNGHLDDGLLGLGLVYSA